MLALTRRSGQGVICVCPDGSSVLVKVIRIAEDQRGVVRVVLGIDAPRTVRVYRDEILMREGGDGGRV